MPDREAITLDRMKVMVADIVPEFDGRLTAWLHSDMQPGSPEHEAMRVFLWDNKVGLLRTAEFVLSLRDQSAELTRLRQSNAALVERQKLVPEWAVKQFMEHRHFTAAHMIDIVARKDGKEYRIEGDWLKQFIPALANA